jgi:sulfur carrier protein
MAEIIQKMIALRINGEPKSVSSGLTIAGLLREIGIDAKKVAVEHNLEIVPRSMLDQVRIENGDTFEIVHFVGGG